MFFFFFSVYVWSVVISGGLEVKSRNGQLQRRRPVPQWMSGQDKDMAGMGDNWSWREVPINMGWVFGPLSWLIHVLPHLQAENECRDWWWRWSRWWNKTGGGLIIFKVGYHPCRSGMRFHSSWYLRDEEIGAETLRRWWTVEKSCLEFSGLLWLMLEKYSDGAWSRPFDVCCMPAYEQWGQTLYIFARKYTLLNKQHRILRFLSFSSSVTEC